MTDKLTPPMWAELAESIRWLDAKISRQSEVGYLLRGLIASFETEAARREAEAGVAAAVEQLAEEHEQNLRNEAARREADVKTYIDGVEVEPGRVIEREGPGSAAAPTKVGPGTPPADDMERAADAVIDCLREDKPAPAADDLVARLRNWSSDDLWGEACEQAADRIEALQAENARLREALERAAKRFRWYEEIHASKTPPDVDKAKRNREFAEDCEAALARGGEHG